VRRTGGSGGSSITPETERGFLREYQKNLRNEVTAMLDATTAGAGEGGAEVEIETAGRETEGKEGLVAVRTRVEEAVIDGAGDGSVNTPL
jgi:hypothetical protein